MCKSLISVSIHRIYLYEENTTFCDWTIDLVIVLEALGLVAEELVLFYFYEYYMKS